MIGGTAGVGLLCAGTRTVLAAASGEGRTRVDMPEDDGGAACRGLLSHRLRPLAGGESFSLCERFSGQVLLIVNTASRCGFTPQFEALETLHGRYVERGLRVLGFPSDDFRQELADEADVASFCRLNYGVTFPMFQKVGVRGADAHPLYRDLAAATGSFPAWNFNKYLVDRDGRAIARYESHEQPLGERLVAAVEALL